MIRMRLRLIAEANFQHSEADNYLALAKKNPDLTLGPDDVVCLLSQSANQMAFVFRPKEVDLETMPGAGARRGTAIVFRSLRVRLTRSTWNPLMIADYASTVGLELEGLKKFNELFEESQAAKGRVIPMKKAA